MVAEMGVHKITVLTRLEPGDLERLDVELAPLESRAARVRRVVQWALGSIAPGMLAHAMLIQQELRCNRCKSSACHCQLPLYGGQHDN
jgi:hypothetical protein